MTEPYSLPGFTPATGLANRHLQTIWPTLFRRVRGLPLTNESWRFADGEAASLDLLPTVADRPGVLVLHGLEGSSASSYVRGVLARAHAAGWNAAALNFRSCAPDAVDGPGAFYHAGKTDDLAHVVQLLRVRWAGAPMAAVGFSLGGNTLLKWLGEQGDAAGLFAAVAISVPYDLARSARSVDGKGFAFRIYRERFLRSLRRKAAFAAKHHPTLVAAHDRRRLDTIEAFDEHVTARLFGFTGAEDYWAQNSSAFHLDGIRRPTLLMSALDDPFVPPAAVPEQIIARNPALTLWRPARGGHVGFVSGSAWAPVYVADALAFSFLEAQVSDPSGLNALRPDSRSPPP